jgi:hypothetical protein
MVKNKQADTNAVMPSSSDGPLWVLARKVGQREAETFAVELLNLDVDSQDAQRRFCTKYAEMIPVVTGAKSPQDEWINRTLTDQGANRLWILREMLSRAWRMPTSWDREIALLQPLHVALSDFHQRHDRGRPLPAMTAAAAKTIGVLLRIQRATDRLRFCGNTSCLAPYFVATRITMKYCSLPCAGQGDRESKRKWWNEVGADRRNEVLKKKKRRKRRAT